MQSIFKLIINNKSQQNYFRLLI